MRKRIFGRRFKRDTNERKALFKNLISAVIIHGRIQTTEEKAKAIKGSLEKLITKAKKQGKQKERLIAPYLNTEAFKKLITDVAPRFSSRPGGYTRIIRLGKRTTDSASMVFLELVDRGSALAVSPASIVSEKTGKKQKVEKEKPRVSRKRVVKTTRKGEAKK